MSLTIDTITIDDVTDGYLPANFERRISRHNIIGGVVFQDFGLYYPDHEITISGTEFKSVINNLFSLFIAGGEHLCEDIWGNEYKAIITNIQVPAEMGSDLLYDYTLKFYITEFTKLYGVVL